VTATSAEPRRAPLGFAADVVAVLVFVAIGRSVHTGGVTVVGMASTAWPFLVGLTLSSSVVCARRWRVASLVVGVTQVVTTVAIGMGLRVVAGQGTAAAFVFVALAFLGLMMLGWRLALEGLARRRRGRTPPAATSRWRRAQSDSK
jgi:hypothetical protein